MEVHSSLCGAGSRIHISLLFPVTTLKAFAAALLLSLPRLLCSGGVPANMSPGMSRQRPGNVSPAPSNKGGLQEPSAREVRRDRDRKHAGETEVEGLRRQKPGSGGNTAWLGPASPLPQQLAATSPRAAQPEPELCRPSYLLSSKDIRGRAGYALLCQQSLPPASPVIRVQCLVVRAGGSPKARLPFSLPGPSPTSCCLLSREQSPYFWPEGGVGATRFV